jgi:hypothetical protein
MSLRGGGVVGLGVLALLGATGAIEGFRHTSQQEASSSGVHASREPASIAAPVSASNSQAVLRFQPEEGKRYTYGFERAIRVSGLGGGHEIPELQYAGKFYVDVQHVDQAGFDAFVSEKVKGFESASSVIFKLHVDSSGKSIRLSAPVLKNEVESQHAGVLKDLISNWVFPLESDTVGSYQARFAALSVHEGIAHGKKAKVAYLKSSKITPEIVSSEHFLEWDLKRAMPQLVLGSETTRIGSGQMSLMSEGHYKIAFEEIAASPALLVSSTEFFHDEALVLSPGSSAARARARLTAADWPKLLARLQQVEALSASEQLALFGDISAYLRTGGSEAAQGLMALLAPSVLAAGPASPLFKTAVGALATAGTPEAQAALLQIYQDPNASIGGKGTILAALTTTQASLTAQTRDFLTTESQTNTNSDLAAGAAWALGSALQNAPGDESTQRSIASLQQAWTGSQGESQQLALLDAMGNSGRAEFLPIISNVIQGGADVTLKSKAVYALRSIQTPEAVALLNQELSDPNPSIRSAASNAESAAVR